MRKFVVNSEINLKYCYYNFKAQDSEVDVRIDIFIDRIYENKDLSTVKLHNMESPEILDILKYSKLLEIYEHCFIPEIVDRIIGYLAKEKIISIIYLSLKGEKVFIESQIQTSDTKYIILHQEIWSSRFYSFNIPEIRKYLKLTWEELFRSIFHWFRVFIRLDELVVLAWKALYHIKYPMYTELFPLNINYDISKCLNAYSFFNESVFFDVDETDIEMFAIFITNKDKSNKYKKKFYKDNF